MELNRFFLFVGSDYYPKGGIADLVSVHSTYEDAVETMWAYNDDWAQIADIFNPDKIKVVHYENETDFFYRSERPPVWVVDEYQ